MAINESRRQAIRRKYRVLRANVGKTQLQVESQARLDKGRYWKIENGHEYAAEDERPALARVLKVSIDELPSADDVALAS